MLLSWYADHRISAAAQFAREDHAEDPGQIRAERDQLQIEHQLRVLFERCRNTDRPIRQFDQIRALLFSALNALLHLANRVEIFAELRPVAVSKAGCERTRFLGYGIE